MRDVTSIQMRDRTYTVRMSPAFHVDFKDGVGGHYPVQNQVKSGQATKGEWVQGVPDEVAEYWEANENPGKSGFVIAPAKPKAVPKGQQVAPIEKPVKVRKASPKVTPKVARKKAAKKATPKSQAS